MVIPDEAAIAVLAAFTAAIALTAVVRDIAIRMGWFDQPNHRSSHSEPTPRLGGVACIGATLMGIGIAPGDLEWKMIGVAAGALLLAVTGLLDDLKPLGPARKFLPQAAAAAVAVAVLRPSISVDLPFASFAMPTIVAWVVATFWIVSMVNAFNFLDGLDGLVAGVAVVSAIAIAMLAQGGASTVLLPFAAAMAGFLVWNTEPARIFMGDVGSQFVGYVLAVSVFMGRGHDVSAIPVVLVFSPVLADAAITILRRLLARQSPFLADRNHVFHGLARAGFKHRTVANLYYGLTGLASLIGFAYIGAGNIGEILLLVAVAVAMVAIVVRFLELPAFLASGRSSASGRTTRQTDMRRSKPVSG